MIPISARYTRVHRGTRRLFNLHVTPTLPYWIAGAATGLIASGYAILFRTLTARSVHLYEQSPVLWSLLVPVGFIASLLSVSLGAPAASGSGIPQVMAAIEKIETGSETWMNRLLGLKTMLWKVVSSTLMIAAGGAIGREGPTIQIGSSLFLSIENFFSRGGFIERKDPIGSRRAFILAGGAAGIAAAFNTPLGGIVFAIEELATQSFKQFRTTVIAGVIVAGVVAQSILGPYLYLGQPTLGKTTWLGTLVAAVVGGLAGLYGGVFGKSLFFLIQWRKKLTSTLRKHICFALVLSVLFIGLTLFSHGLSIGSGAEGIGSVLFENKPVTYLDSIIRFLASQVSFLVGGAGGIFAPALSVGAYFGAGIANIIPGVDPHLLVLVGMSAFLTGVTHAPFTSLVLVVEMTDRSGAIFPLMLGTLTAYWISKILSEHSFYEKVREQYLPTSNERVTELKNE